MTISESDFDVINLGPVEDDRPPFAAAALALEANALQRRHDVDVALPTQHRGRHQSTVAAGATFDAERMSALFNSVDAVVPRPARATLRIMTGSLNSRPESLSPWS